MNGKSKGRFSISGPGIEKNGYETSGQALSAATTNADRVADGATVYVYDGDKIVGRVERHDRDRHIYGPRHYGVTA